MDLIEHALNEFHLGGFHPEKIKRDTVINSNNYADCISKAVLDLLHVLVKYSFSEFSISQVVEIFSRLALHQALSQLTDNLEEWEDISSVTGYKCYKSKRILSCYTNDLKVYYDTNNPENNNTVTENGQTVYVLKPYNERQFIELKHYEDKK